MVAFLLSISCWFYTFAFYKKHKQPCPLNSRNYIILEIGLLSWGDWLSLTLAFYEEEIPRILEQLTPGGLSDSFLSRASESELGEEGWSVQTLLLIFSHARAPRQETRQSLPW